MQRVFFSIRYLVNSLHHSVHWGINPPPQKHYPPPPLFLAKPPLNWQTLQAPSFQAISPSILVFHEPLPPPLKVVFFSEPPKH